MAGQMNRLERWEYIPTTETHQQVDLFLSHPIPLSFSKNKVRAMICPIQLMKTKDMGGDMGKPMADSC